MGLFIGITGLTLSAEDIKRISHPYCDGVILFTRNYQDKTQLKALTKSIRGVNPALIISVDHEGGRVQRFKDGFTQIPPMQYLGKLFDQSPLLSYQLTKAIGIIIAYELISVDIDFSYIPVLDLANPISSVIGDRAFHENPAIVSNLASALRQGLRTIGMAAIGKHFPGHGNVEGDSHEMLPSDLREEKEREKDLYPFLQQIDDHIEAFMTAHILLKDDDKPVTFSNQHMQYLRKAGFNGLIVSDDLDMAGAHFFKDPLERVAQCYQAGIDTIMICNNFTDMDTVLFHYPFDEKTAQYQTRLQALKAKKLPENAEKIYQNALNFFKENHDQILNMA